MTILEIVSQLATPVVVLILGIVYKNIFEKVVTRFQSISFKLPAGGEVKLTTEKAEETLSELFTQFHSVYHQLLKTS